MKRFSLIGAILIVVTAISAAAVPNPSTANVPAFPGTLANARYVYVASYDGDQFNPNLLPEDRNAIGAVQDAIQNWGKLTLVYQPSQADIIILVTSPTFRRSDGRVRRAPRAEWQFSPARHGA
jgi:predicted Zn-dependent protease